jgi:hypothetical protein
MLNPGYVSIERVIENVIRDTGFTTELEWIDVLEWTYRACELIGSKNTYIMKVTDGNSDLNHFSPIEIVNGRGTLPSDFHQLYQAREYCMNRPMRSSQYNYLISTHSPDYYAGSDLTYNINNDYIFTSFQEGKVELAYYAFPIDEKGYPMVPNDERYIQAVESYITHRITTKLWMQDKMSTDKQKYWEAEWLFYVNSARSKDNVLTVDQAESLKNQLLRLVQRPTQYNRAFLTLGYAEQGIINRNNRFGRPF